jgi:tartrate dehydratase beta subunit/fumarate hydratase class I family protein
MVDLRSGMLAGLGVNFDTATSLTETVGPREQDRMQGLVESVLARYGVSVNVGKSTRLRARWKNYASEKLSV